MARKYYDRHGNEVSGDVGKMKPTEEEIPSGSTIPPGGEGDDAINKRREARRKKKAAKKSGNSWM